MEKVLLTPRDDIFVVRHFLSADECEALVRRAEEIGFDEATVNAFGGSTVVNKGMRNNERVMIDDFALAAELWSKLEALVPDRHGGAAGLNERFRFYRYEPGQYFDWHFDAAFRRGGESSDLTFMIYLNQCAGGTTEFNFKSGVIRDDDPVLSVTPETGMALVFTHNVLHRGAPVTEGRKYVLRSDVMYRTAGEITSVS